MRLNRFITAALGLFAIIAFNVASSGAADAESLTVVTGSTTMTTSSSCGPLYVYSSPVQFYCTSPPYSCSTTTSSSIYVGGAQIAVPGSTTAFQANAGIGSQFLNVVWDHPMAGSLTFYVISLQPNQAFSFLVYC
jgi:hypothetical protein